MLVVSMQGQQDVVLYPIILPVVSEATEQYSGHFPRYCK